MPGGSSISFTATSRLSNASCACQTVPMPPCPIAARSRYLLPTRVPGTARSSGAGGNEDSPCHVEGWVVTAFLPSHRSANVNACPGRARPVGLPAPLTRPANVCLTIVLGRRQKGKSGHARTGQVVIFRSATCCDDSPSVLPLRDYAAACERAAQRIRFPDPPDLRATGC